MSKRKGNRKGRSDKSQTQGGGLDLKTPIEAKRLKEERMTPFQKPVNDAMIFGILALLSMSIAGTLAYCAWVNQSTALGAFAALCGIAGLAFLFQWIARAAAKSNSKALALLDRIRSYLAIE